MEYIAKPRTRVICPECIIIIKTHSTTSFQCWKCKNYYSVYAYAVPADEINPDMKKYQEYFAYKLCNKYGKPIHRLLNRKSKPSQFQRVTITSYVQKKEERAFSPNPLIRRFN